MISAKAVLSCLASKGNQGRPKGRARLGAILVLVYHFNESLTVSVASAFLIRAGSKDGNLWVVICGGLRRDTPRLMIAMSGRTVDTAYSLNPLLHQ